MTLSLNSQSFVVRCAGLSNPILASMAILLSGIAMGCAPQARHQRVEDSLTSGRILIVCAHEATSLISRERAAFAALYPQSSFEVRDTTSREAIRALFAAECDLAVITRELSPEERAAAVRGRLELEGYRFARDAVVMLVNPGNRVENLAMDDLGKIYQGEVTDWSELGGAPGAIEPIAQRANRDITDFFVARVLAGEPMRARVRVADADSQVVAEVTSHPGAIGYVSLAWAERGAKALHVSSLTGLKYWAPDLETVYAGEYPLTRFFNFYRRPRGAQLGAGFITYVTSMDGQRDVHEAGLVPTAVPVRFVRRSPMLSSH